MNYDRAEYEATNHENALAYVRRLGCETAHDAVSDLEMDGEMTGDMVPAIAEVFEVGEGAVWDEWATCQEATAECSQERRNEVRYGLG